MVAVQMGYKDMVDSAEFKPLLPEFYLGAFTAIDKEKLITAFQNLGSGIRMAARCGRMTSQDMEFHDRKVFSG